jgi:hypothetical protein
MDLSTLASMILWKIVRKVKEYIFISKEIFTEENGKMINLMAMGCIFLPMEINTKVMFFKEKRKAMEFILTRMATYIRVFGRMIKKVETDNTCLLMEMYIKANLRKALDMDKEFLNGLREIFMKVLFLKGIRMGEES